MVKRATLKDSNYHKYFRYVWTHVTVLTDYHDLEVLATEAAKKGGGTFS